MTARQTGDVLAMVGGGYYWQRTRGAKDVIDSALPLVTAAMDGLPALPSGAALRVADYGAADGGTSQEMWHAALTHLRARDPARQAVVTYTDLPSNDFSTLFKLMQGIGGDGAHAYQKLMPGVFVHGCGTGFHQQLFPDASIHVGFSATAMHYVSEKPCEISRHVHHTGAAGEERAAFDRQGAADWERILLARAAELVPGGRMICVNFGIDEENRWLGNTGGKPMFDTFHKHWKALADAGLITADEYRRATFAQVYRTREEFCAPLNDPQSRVSQVGLRLVDSWTRLTPCPYRAAFEAANGAMSAREFARSYIPTLRSWSETVFRTALDSARPAADAAAIVDRFYQAYEDEVAADPAGHAMDYIHVFIVMEKTG